MGKMSELAAQKEVIDEINEIDFKPLDIPETNVRSAISSWKKTMLSLVASALETYKVNSTKPIMNSEVAVLKISFIESDGETEPRYDVDDLRAQMQGVLDELENMQQGITDGWYEKQQDYAMDNMTCDKVDEEEK